MQTNFLKHLIENLAGSSSIPIIPILNGKKDVNEFLIAKKMDLTINQVRNILYKLSAEGLVSFIRKKDKRKGWYIYFWTLDEYKCLLKIESDLIGEIQKLKLELESRQQRNFYHCKTCKLEVTEEKALEEDFSCEECAETYELLDSSSLIKDLTNKINRKERDLSQIRSEIETTVELQSKVMEKRRKKQEADELKIKEEKKIQRKKAREEKAKKEGNVKKTPIKKAIAEDKAEKKESIKKTTKAKIVAKKTTVKKTAKRK